MDKSSIKEQTAPIREQATGNIDSDMICAPASKTPAKPRRKLRTRCTVPKQKTQDQVAPMQEYMYQEGDMFVYFNINKVRHKTEEEQEKDALYNTTSFFVRQLIEDTEARNSESIRYIIESFIQKHWNKIKQIDTGGYVQSNNMFKKHTITPYLAYDAKNDGVPDDKLNIVVRERLNNFTRAIKTMKHNILASKIDSIDLTSSVSINCLVNINANSIYKYLTQVDDYMLLDYEIDEYQKLTFYFKLGDLLNLNQLAHDLRSVNKFPQVYVSKMKDKGVNEALTLLLELIANEPNFKQYYEVLSGNYITVKEFNEAKSLKEHKLSAGEQLCYDIHIINMAKGYDRVMLSKNLRSGKAHIVAEDYSKDCFSYIKDNMCRDDLCSEKDLLAEIDKITPILKAIECYSEPDFSIVSKVSDFDIFITRLALYLYKVNTRECMLKSYNNYFPKVIFNNVKDIYKTIMDDINKDYLIQSYEQAFGKSPDDKELKEVCHAVAEVFSRKKTRPEQEVKEEVMLKIKESNLPPSLQKLSESEKTEVMKKINK